MNNLLHDSALAQAMRGDGIKYKTISEIARSYAKALLRNPATLRACASLLQEKNHMGFRRNAAGNLRTVDMSEDTATAMAETCILAILTEAGL